MRILRAEIRAENVLKNSTIIAIMTWNAIAVPCIFAQSTTQSVNVTVTTVYVIATSGNPANLVVTTGTAGSDALASVSDNTTTYSITQNFGNTVMITAFLDSPLQAGYALTIRLGSSKGFSLGDVDISNTVSTNALSVVTGINPGADANQPITYTFSALASAGQLSSTPKTVTLTLTN